MYSNLVVKVWFAVSKANHQFIIIVIGVLIFRCANIEI